MHFNLKATRSHIDTTRRFPVSQLCKLLCLRLLARLLSVDLHRERNTHQDGLASLLLSDSLSFWMQSFFVRKTLFYIIQRLFTDS